MLAAFKMSFDTFTIRRSEVIAICFPLILIEWILISHWSLSLSINRPFQHFSFWNIVMFRMFMKWLSGTRSDNAFYGRKSGFNFSHFRSRNPSLSLSLLKWWRQIRSADLFMHRHWTIRCAVTMTINLLRQKSKVKSIITFCLCSPIDEYE